MNIPNLPTDNLYKFFSILGIIIFLSGAILTYRSFDIKVKNDIFLIDSETYKAELNSDSNKTKGKIIPLIYVSSIIMVSGFLISFFGLYFWYNKTQKFQDKILNKEARKYLEEQNLRIRTVQFEKEYLIYETLWKELNKLRIEMDRLKEESDAIIQNNGKDEDISVLLSSDYPFNIAVNDFKIKFEENRPFIPNDIYEFGDKIDDLCLSLFNKRLVTSLEVMAGVESDFSDIIKQIRVTIEMLCDKIRMRIKITEEI
jgi:hypothetical protein